MFFSPPLVVFCKKNNKTFRGVNHTQMFATDVKWDNIHPSTIRWRQPQEPITVQEDDDESRQPIRIHYENTR